MEREREGQFIFFHTFRETEREKERKTEKINPRQSKDYNQNKIKTYPKKAKVIY